MKRSLWIVALAVVVIAAFALAGCSSQSGGNTSTPPTGGTSGGGTSGGTATEVQVAISGFAFDPASVEIAAGGTVTWTNNDSASHTVTGSGWESASLAQGDTFSHTFATAGTYDYACSVHPSMKGTVVVK